MTNDFTNFTISASQTISDALVKIEINTMGFICALDESDRLIGLMTDGDIRRHLISGGKLSDIISFAVNRNFTYVDDKATNEEILKLFDAKIMFVPMVGRNGQLIRLFQKDNLNFQNRTLKHVRSKAPARVSFGGGGSDVTYYYGDDASGAVLSSAISMYAHAALKPTLDNKIRVKSIDLNGEFESEKFHLDIKIDDKFSLIKSIINVVKPTSGFELVIHCDFPKSSGLGGSASVCAAILGCFNEFFNRGWNNHDLVELAYHAERHRLGVEGGWQDQYAAVFGGINLIEFERKENKVHSVRLSEEIKLELMESCLLAFTGVEHDSGKIHLDQREAASARFVKKNIEQNVRLTYEMRDDLLRGRIEKLGEKLNQAWEYKKTFSSQISNDYLDDIYRGAMQNGALGGKILGAGGGGYFLFIVDPFRRPELVDYLQSAGLHTQAVNFDTAGLTSWQVR
jgi:D-glycero-alpha-D-manno-heptose-7-phosphate kinase